MPYPQTPTTESEPVTWPQRKSEALLRTIGNADAAKRDGLRARRYGQRISGNSSNPARPPGQRQVDDEAQQREWHRRLIYAKRDGNIRERDEVIREIAPLERVAADKLARTYGIDAATIEAIRAEQPPEPVEPEPEPITRAELSAKAERAGLSLNDLADEVALTQGDRRKSVRERFRAYAVGRVPTLNTRDLQDALAIIAEAT